MSNSLTDSLWNAIKSAVTRNAAQYLYVPIPKSATDLEYDDLPLKANCSYLRLWLSEMFLTKSRKWFEDWYPAVHSSVRLKFSGQPAANFSSVARAPESVLAPGVLLNYRLTELVPFLGGVVEIEAGLLALQGKNYLKSVINVMADFSSLIAPPFGQALAIAEKISSGMEGIVNSTNGQVHLAFHESFTAAGSGSGELRPGYIAVLLATAEQIESGRLSVKNNRLHYLFDLGENPVPLDCCDYMLFRIEVRQERDDWRMPAIQEPLDRAKEALVRGEREQAELFKKTALVAAWQSADLAPHDRRRVVQAIKEEFKAIEEDGISLIADEGGELGDILARRRMPVEVAASLPQMTIDEILAD